MISQDDFDYMFCLLDDSLLAQQVNYDPVRRQQVNYDPVRSYTLKRRYKLLWQSMARKLRSKHFCI